ncbi:hypothetical protein C4565_03390 [Candidatus Parcubacteria bacterium]|nr:MAG: hypothetical protein C4565_03390 [Candidatus Parcubacteria bacterium]
MNVPNAMTLDGLVDHFTGDFQYTVPLLELPGPQGSFPFSISYRSGILTEQEASWVGLGWSLEPGRISRGMRGIPDDLAGEEVKQLFHQRPARTIGAAGSVGAELWGLDSRLLSVGASLGLDLFFDTYSGYGLALQLSPKANVKLANNLGGSLGMAANLNTQQGTTVNANLALNLGLKNLNPSFGAAYNSRTGLESAYWGYYGVPLFAPSYLATQLRSQYGARNDFAIKVGAELWGIYPEGELKGYFGETRYGMPSSRSAYGYLYLNQGQGASEEAMFDFTREKEAPLKPKTPYLPFMLLTNDVFDMAISGGPGGSFRAFRNDLPVLGDPTVHSSNSATNMAGEVGIGTVAHGGGAGQGTVAESESATWYDDKFVHAAGQAFTGEERVYFAFTSELSAEADSSVHPSQPLFVKLDDTKNTFGVLQGFTGTWDPHISEKSKPRATFIRAVTEKDVLDCAAMVQDTPGNQNTVEMEKCKWIVGQFMHEGIKRPSEAGQRIAGFDIVTSDGIHYVFAQPAYVNREVNCSFSVNPSTEDLPKGESIVDIPAETGQSISNWFNNSSTSVQLSDSEETDQFLSCTSNPKYAHTYHLTSVLGSTYLDSDQVPGPSIDDLGHWVRLEYAVIENYAFRSPFYGAHYDPGFTKSFLRDDRGSFSYGEKDVYFLEAAYTASHYVKAKRGMRKDSMGAASIINTGGRGKQLPRLEKLELFRNGDTNPIRSVGFEYDYRLAPGIPNGMNAGQGKLMLSRFWIENGGDKSGMRSPWIFDYGYNPKYQRSDWPGERQSDRWGTFQSCNPIGSYLDPSILRRCSNTDEPYTRQNGDVDLNAVAWSLRSIITSSGARINVEYEADDYAYVQDERAAVMVAGCEEEIQVEGPKYEICIDLNKSGLAEVPQEEQEFGQYVNRLLRGTNGDANQVAFVADVKLRPLSSGDLWDTVRGYIELSDEGYRFDATAGKLYLRVKPVQQKYHPLAVAAWQHLKMNQPQYSVPGVSPIPLYEANINDFTQIKNAAQGLVNMVGKILDTFDNFSEQAAKEGWGNHVRKAKFRLFEPTGFKKGGGARVSKITVCDSGRMDVDCSNPAYSIGRLYSYTLEEDGRAISSGVAAYEPALGGDEIPLRRAEFYSEKRILSPNDPAYFEHPLGESLFPAPVVGYSQVVERTLAGEYAKNNPDQGVSTAGERIFEFYTAKDFPVKVQASIIQKPEPVRDLYPMPGIGTILHEAFAASQGFRIELNDMHGKPKRLAEYALRPNGTRAEGIDRETRYFYNVSTRSTHQLDPGSFDLHSFGENSPMVYVSKMPGTWAPGEGGLNNSNQQGEIKSGTLGQRVEYYADMRESVNSINSMGMSVNVDTILGGFIPIPIPVPWPSYDDSIKESRTSAFHQIVHQSGVLLRTEISDKSASLLQSNLAFDPARGTPILTSQTNSFGDPVYDFRIPAYWLHPDMGPAFQQSQGQNLLAADAIVLKTMSNPLEAESSSCDLQIKNEKISTLSLPEVLDISLVLHSDNNLINEDLLAHHAPSLDEADFWKLTRKGWWLPVATYRVESGRCYALNPSPQKDGIYNIDVKIPVSEVSGTFERFVRFCAPEWRETERFIKYHPRGPALHSSSPLGRQDAVLYGRKGAVVRAIGQNTPYDLIGFENFESYETDEPLQFKDLDDGNIDFWTDKDPEPEIQYWDEGYILDGWIEWIRCPFCPEFDFGGGDIDPLPMYIQVLIEMPDGRTRLFKPRIERMERRDGKWFAKPATPLPYNNRAVSVIITLQRRAGTIFDWLKGVNKAEKPHAEVTTRAAHTGERSLSVKGTMAFEQFRLFSREEDVPKNRYVLSAWVSKENTDHATYAATSKRLGIGVLIGGAISPEGEWTGGRMTLFEPSGPIIDGWQRVEGEFDYDYPEDGKLGFIFQSGGSEEFFIDDIRIHPKDAALETYVYNPRTLKPIARLDQNNVATRWQYGEDGQLRLVERETLRGWRTMIEHYNHQAMQSGDQ